MEEVGKRVLSGLQKRWGAVFQHQVTNVLAYGSGAFPQTKDKQAFAANTLDLIVEVRAADVFHRELMRVSPSDYSGAVSIAGASLLNWTGSSIFPMHSNHITLDGKPLKYSVIGQAPLREDLRTWKYLSFAGRLHKPVLPLRPLSEGLGEDLSRNREIAVAVALLLFGGKGRSLSHGDFFHKICEISYLGDVRFAAGAENPMKMHNIVNNNYLKFQEIYLPILRKFSAKMPTSLTVERDQMSFLYTAPSLALLLPHLPKSLLDPIA
jgi:mitochondrial translocator assembly and maintenance protein 41